MGLPYICPYNVNSIMNPILVACLGLGYFFNLYRGKPVVREGGVAILSHPTPWAFHPVHHPSYIDFFEQVLSETTDPLEIEAKYEESFARDPWYIHLYRTSYAYHGVHPFYMWYWCAHALEHLGAVIIVGGDRAAVRRMGFKPATTLADALEMAEDVVGARPDDHPPAHCRRSSSPTSRERAAASATPRSTRSAHADLARRASGTPRASAEHSASTTTPLGTALRGPPRAGGAHRQRRRRPLDPPGSPTRRSTAPSTSSRCDGTGDLRRQPHEPSRHRGRARRRCRRAFATTPSSPRRPTTSSTARWKAALWSLAARHDPDRAHAGQPPERRPRRRADRRRLEPRHLPRGRPQPRRLGTGVPRRRRLPRQALRRAGRADPPPTACGPIFPKGSGALAPGQGRGALRRRRCVPAPPATDGEAVRRTPGASRARIEAAVADARRRGRDGLVVGPPARRARDDTPPFRGPESHLAARPWACPRVGAGGTRAHRRGNRRSPGRAATTSAQRTRSTGTRKRGRWGEPAPFSIRLDQAPEGGSVAPVV